MERYQESFEASKKALSIDSESAAAWNNKSWALINLSHYEEALEASEKALGLNPRSVEIWDTRSKALINAGKYQEALEAVEESLRLKPEYIEAWQNKGVALANLKQNNEAVEWLCRAWLAREHLSDKGSLIEETLRALGHEPKECEDETSQPR